MCINCCLFIILIIIKYIFKGSEVVQFEPAINPELLFNMEEVFLPPNNQATDFLATQIQVNNNNNNNQSLKPSTNSTISFDDDDFILDDDFTDANILLDDNKLAANPKLPITRQRTTTTKKN